jgi:hypothetical protein
MPEILRRLNSRIFLVNSLLYRCLNCKQRSLIDESGMIKTYMGIHDRSEKAAVHGTLCTIPTSDQQPVTTLSSRVPFDEVIVFQLVKKFLKLVLACSLGPATDLYSKPDKSYIPTYLQQIFLPIIK